MTTETTHSIIKTRGINGDTKEVTGTIEYLNEYFGYTLIAGDSYNNKINPNPKTIKQLVSALNKSVEQTQNGYYRDSYEIG